MGGCGQRPRWSAPDGQAMRIDTRCDLSGEARQIVKTSKVCPSRPKHTRSRADATQSPWDVAHVRALRVEADAAAALQQHHLELVALGPLNHRTDQDRVRVVWRDRKQAASNAQ